MATDNVEFYERMQKLQAIQEQREQQRMSLERELNSYVKSDKRLSRVRASQLQSYWDKICEDERRSRARNEQLLREYDRVEAHMAALSARTERLRLLKDQYEKQIEMMYPRWREEVEIKRRQRLLQQQKEQQQMAQKIQQLQQQQSYTQQQPMQQQQQQPNYLSPNQQPQEQQYGSLQMQNVDDVEYNHLRRTNPSIPNIQVQANTPPQVTPQDPRYTSIQFSTQPPSYRTPTTQHEHSAHYPNKMSTGSNSYEVPIGGGTFPILSKQPQMRNGLQTKLNQQTQSGAPKVRAPGEVFQLQEPPSNMDIGYSKLHSEISVPTSKDTLPRYPNSSSTYSEVRTNKTAGSGSQNAAILGSNSQVIVKSKTRPPAVNIENQKVNSGGDAPSHQDPHPRHQKTRFHDKPVEKQTTLTNNEIPQDDDSIVTPLNDEDDYAYLEPSAVKSEVRKTRPKTGDSLKPVERASSAVSPKVVSTARTDPFTSEDDDDDDDDDDDEEEEEEEEEEENGTEERALRHALQKQLNIKDDTAHGRNQMSDKGQAKSGLKDQQKGMTEGKGESITEKPPQISGATQSRKPLAEDTDSESDSESEIASDLSLPLSDDGGVDVPHRSDDSHQKPVKKSTEASKAQGTSSQPKVAIEMVSKDGFWHLVAAVEQEIEESDNIEKIYNLPECTTAIKNEIVKTVNNNGSLEYLNPNAISMVVLEQLQQIAHSMPGGCLLSDKLLDTKRTITEVTIRSFLYSSALAFWDKLLQHLVLLVRRGVMEAEEVASMVAPRLINPHSACRDKAVDILTTILQDLEKQEDGGLDDTYSTLPSASATPSHQLDASPLEEAQNTPQAPPPVPPLDLGATPNHESPELETDRVSHDSFFDEPKVPLKETKAYQQMMQSSHGHTKPASQDIARPDVDSDHDGLSLSSDEEDDEIEKATRLSPEMPSSARNKKRRNILSSLGGSGSLGISYGDGDNDKAGDDRGGSGGGTKRSEGMSDVISSASQSPSPKGSGYVQSAKNLEQSLKSTGRSDPTQRSAAFWGEESDMEESEMTVPMGTGTLKSDDFKDDFDFYD